MLTEMRVIGGCSVCNGVSWWSDAKGVQSDLFARGLGSFDTFRGHTFRGPHQAGTG